jgi:hypothetical protein
MPVLEETAPSRVSAAWSRFFTEAVREKFSAGEEKVPVKQPHSYSHIIIGNFKRAFKWVTFMRAQVI